jgi:hypothetical protein
VEVFGVLLCFVVAGLVWKLIEPLFVFGIDPKPVLWDLFKHGQSLKRTPKLNDSGVLARDPASIELHRLNWGPRRP